MEQDLFNEKGGGFPNYTTRSARGFGCLSCRLFVTGGDANQDDHIVRQGS
jgi:hypothetical protein